MRGHQVRSAVRCQSRFCEGCFSRRYLTPCPVYMARTVYFVAREGGVDCDVMSINRPAFLRRIRACKQDAEPLRGTSFFRNGETASANAMSGNTQMLLEGFEMLQFKMRPWAQRPWAQILVRRRSLRRYHLRRLLAVVGLLIVVPLVTNAAQQESEKSARVRAILLNKHFYSEQPHRAVCNKFFKDFRAQTRITFVEPIVSANSYDSPVLATIKQHCAAQPLNETFECDARATSGVEWALAWKDRRQQLLQYCRAFYGTKNIKIFRAEIDNDPTNGAELVVYSERIYGPANKEQKRYYGNGGYSFFRGDECEYIGGVTTHDPYSYLHQQPRENYNGLISYRDKYYVFDLYDLDGSDRDANEPSYYLSLYTLDDTRTNWCSFSTISPEYIHKKSR
jgi:hypothetical protein